MTWQSTLILIVEAKRASWFRSTCLTVKQQDSNPSWSGNPHSVHEGPADKRSLEQGLLEGHGESSVLPPMLLRHRCCSSVRSSKIVSLTVWELTGVIPRFYSHQWCTSWHIILIMLVLKLPDMVLGLTIHRSLALLGKGCLVLASSLLESNKRHHFLRPVILFLKCNTQNWLQCPMWWFSSTHVDWTNRKYCLMSHINMMPSLIWCT